MSEQNEPTEAEIEPVVALVPVDDEGTYFAFGDLAELELGEFLPTPYVKQEQVAALSNVIALGVGATNVAAQVARASAGSFGLVRLAPQTLQALKTGAQPLQSGGWNLGVLARGGKFSNQVRWMPAGAGNAVEALSMIGPAAAILAVQWQLTAISKAIDKNIQLTQTVLDHLRASDWHELNAAAATVVQQARYAQALGRITGPTEGFLNGQNALMILEKHRRFHLEALQTRRQALAQGGDRSGEWFKTNFAELLRDGQAVLTAQQAISAHRIMQAACYAQPDRPSEDRELSGLILDDARAQHVECAATLDAVLRDLNRSFSLWYDARPGATVQVFGEQVSIRDVRDAVRDLHARAVAGPFHRLEPLPEAKPVAARTSVALPEGDRPTFERHLQWLLEEDENVELLAFGRFKWRHGRAPTSRRHRATRVPRPRLDLEGGQGRLHGPADGHHVHAKGPRR